MNTASPKILISGFYSGPSPSAGLGIAKSLREAWPSAHITGIDYWEGSSGLHHSVLSERIVFPSWELIELEAHAEKLKALSQDHIIISALDAEIHWLSQYQVASRNWLIPRLASLEFAEKPRIEIHKFLPFKTPAIHLGNAGDQELFDFCRAHSWRIWVKGRYHGARFASNWRDLDAARRAFATDGDFSCISYQAHVRGVEESICFAAFEGKLLDAVHMQKRVTTPDGKTWSGKVLPITHRQREVIADAIKAMQWTGGGELELIRDELDQYWLMEFNPRFPAWIYGATLAGYNLPAKLVTAASNFAPSAGPLSLSNEFTRVVSEIPVRPEIALPAIRQPEHGEISSYGKYGYSYSSLERKILGNGSKSQGFAEENHSGLSDGMTREWVEQISAATQTPARIRLDSTIQDHMQFAASLMNLNHQGCSYEVAYSIKTCPDDFYLKLARESGLKAEAISMAEVEKALYSGWKTNEVILNGPAKWWPRSINENQGLASVFCDSLDEFERLLHSKRHDLQWGFRLKIPGFTSRFGAELDSIDELTRMVRLVESMPKDIDLGFHIHLASNLLGQGHWKDAVNSAINWACTVSQYTNRTISNIDFGGGYHPRDFRKIPWHSILIEAKEMIPTLKKITIEPGRALSQDTMLLVTSVQDIRKRRSDIHEIVVDTCISELPLAKAYPHRMYVLRDETLIPIGHGNARILGRICMEDDIIADSVTLPATLKLGDKLVIADAGAYERSMSYDFGTGRLATQI